MNYPKPISLKETVSTNSYLAQLCDREKQEDFTCVYTSFQSAGRGQRGNSWESEAGKNLLFSFVVYPKFLEAGRQFLLAQITALALQETLSRYVEDITIKWPNDIYWKDKKICGTLIENDFTGTFLGRSISGTGVNLNQKVFLSDAPNPVSLTQITGRIYDSEEVLYGILDRISSYYVSLQQDNTAIIVSRYKNNLYRGQGYHPFTDINGAFMARIADVESSGQIVLEDETGKYRKYMFKEIEYLRER